MTSLREFVFSFRHRFLHVERGVSAGERKSPPAIRPHVDDAFRVCGQAHASPHCCIAKLSGSRGLIGVSGGQGPSLEAVGNSRADISDLLGKDIMSLVKVRRATQITLPGDIRKAG